MKKKWLLMLVMVIFSSKIFATQELELVIQTGHSDSVLSVSFSPDGKYLASGGDDRTIKFWDVETGELIKTLEGHTGDVHSVIFSPDGKYLASGSGDGMVKLWNGVGSGAIVKAVATFDNESYSETYYKGGLIATLFATKEGEYVVYTPDGYYDCSPKGHNLVLVRLNNKLVPYDEDYKYKQTFHRPDMIQQRLSGKK